MSLKAFDTQPIRPFSRLIKVNTGIVSNRSSLGESLKYNSRVQMSVISTTMSSLIVLSPIRIEGIDVILKVICTKPSV